MRQDTCEADINPDLVIFEEELNNTEDRLGRQGKYENHW